MRHSASRFRLPCLVAAGLLAVSATSFADQANAQRNPCDDGSHGDRARYCEVRQETFAFTGDKLSVDATPNGGITVHGWNRQDVQLEAKVVVNADTMEQSRAIAAQVRVLTDGGRVRAEGPEQANGRNWSVSYDLRVPTQAGLDLRATNGGISIADVQARVTFRTTNGGVKISNVNGEIHGATTNGGVQVDLDGPGWYGEGLDVQTHNGGVVLRMPEGYSAHLEAGTQNGGLRVDFPMTVQAQVDRSVKTDLGRGGAPITLTTINGGVSITRR